MNRLSGFSLLELLITLVIIGILSGYGLSLFPGLHQKNQSEVIMDEIKQAIHYAKMEALTSGNTVTLGPIAANGDWSSGMLMFVDNESHHVTSNTRLIREWKWKRTGIEVQWFGFESREYLRISPGLLERGASGHFKLSDGGKRERQLIVNRLASTRESGELLFSKE